MSLIPVISHVQAAVDLTAFGQTVNPIITHIVYPIVALLFAVAVIAFVYGVLQIVLKGDDEEARKQGKSSILYGSIGMFIMVSAWGIIYLISNTVKTL